MKVPTVSALLAQTLPHMTEALVFAPAPLLRVVQTVGEPVPTVGRVVEASL